MYVPIVPRERRREGGPSCIHVFDDIYVCPYYGRTAVEQRVLQRGDSVYVGSGTYHRIRGRLLAYTQVDG